MANWLTQLDAVMIGRMERKIRAVTFDLWQTLLLEDGKLGRKRAELRISGTSNALTSAGYRFSDERLWEAYWNCAKACNVIRSKGLDVSFGEQIDIFIEQIQSGQSLDLPRSLVTEISTTYDEAFLAYPLSLDPDAVATLAKLKDQGYALGLISNTGMTPGSTFRVYMDQLGILAYFDTLVFSNEVRLSKPAPEIFHIALDALRVSSDMAIHVGDDRAKDVAGAKAAGMRSIWISRPAESYETRTPKDKSDTVTPDVTVSRLGDVVGAIAGLARG